MDSPQYLPQVAVKTTTATTEMENVLLSSGGRIRMGVGVEYFVVIKHTSWWSQSHGYKTQGHYRQYMPRG